jgi:hypothetical protein
VNLSATSLNIFNVGNNLMKSVVIVVLIVQPRKSKITDIKII